MYEMYTESGNVIVGEIVQNAKKYPDKIAYAEEALQRLAKQPGYEEAFDIAVRDAVNAALKESLFIPVMSSITIWIGCLAMLCAVLLTAMFLHPLAVVFVLGGYLAGYGLMIRRFS